MTRYQYFVLIIIIKYLFQLFLKLINYKIMNLYKINVYFQDLLRNYIHLQKNIKVFLNFNKNYYC